MGVYVFDNILVRMPQCKEPPLQCSKVLYTYNYRILVTSHVETNRFTEQYKIQGSYRETENVT